MTGYRGIMGRKVICNILFVNTFLPRKGLYVKLITAFLFILVSCPAYAANYTKVALVSVSSAYDEQEIPYVVSALEKKGYEVTDRYLKQAISDLGYVDVVAARTKHLTDAMLDDSIDVIWFVRGGGGSVNTLPLLEKHLKTLKRAKPKVLIGFSDVTAVHEFVNKSLGWKSIHGIVAAFNADVYAYRVYVMTRNFFWDMTRKLSVTLSQYISQFFGTSSFKNPIIACAKSLKCS